MSTSPRHKAARELASRGIPIFPLRGKKPIVKDDGRRWGKTTDLAQIDEWWAEADYNIGLQPCDLPGGAVAIDLDTYKPGGVSQAVLDMLPETRTHATPSGGLQIICATSELFTNRGLAVNVDVRGANGFVVWPPSVIDGVEYKVVDAMWPPAPLPDTVRAALRRRDEPAEVCHVADDGVDKMPDEAREWCQRYAETGNQSDRFVAAAALVRNFGLTNATATALATEFGLRMASGQQEGTSWEQTLDNARRHGTGNVGEGVAWKQPEAEDTIPPEVERWAEAEGPREPSIWVDGWADMLTREFPKLEWLVDRIILRGHVNLLYGEPKSGKTVLALGIAASVSTGTDFLGQTTKKAPVVGVFNEDDEAAVQMHLKAGIMPFPPETAEPPSFTCRPGCDPTVAVVDDKGQFTWGEFAGKLVEKIRAKPKGCLVILDHAAIVGVLNENFKIPVAVFLRKLDALCQKEDCSMLLLAHPTSAGVRSNDTGASPAWRANTRNCIIFTRPDKGINCEISVSGNYGPGLTIKSQFRYPLFTREQEAEPKPSSLRLRVLDTIGSSTVETRLTTVEFDGFEPKTVEKACHSGPLADLMKRHADGTLWWPLTFNPQR